MKIDCAPRTHIEGARNDSVSSPPARDSLQRAAQAREEVDVYIPSPSSPLPLHPPASRLFTFFDFPEVASSGFCGTGDESDLPCDEDDAGASRDLARAREARTNAATQPAKTTAPMHR